MVTRCYLSFGFPRRSDTTYETDTQMFVRYVEEIQTKRLRSLSSLRKGLKDRDHYILVYHYKLLCIFQNLLKIVQILIIRI